jgi:hypothetical protein
LTPGSDCARQILSLLNSWRRCDEVMINIARPARGSRMNVGRVIAESWIGFRECHDFWQVELHRQQHRTVLLFPMCRSQTKNYQPDRFHRCRHPVRRLKPSTDNFIGGQLLARCPQKCIAALRIYLEDVIVVHLEAAGWATEPHKHIRSSEYRQSTV